VSIRFGERSSLNTSISVLSSSPIVGIGEILWDLLPSGRALGGAPANFAYCSRLLGARATVVSRVGNDELGSEIRDRVRQAEIADAFIQTDARHPTGTVKVKVDLKGQPTFEIVGPVAWDFLEWGDDLKVLAEASGAVCFGTLAQRSEASRRTICKFLDSTKPEAARVFDVNLRQSCYSAAIIEDSLRRTTVLKLNDQELPMLSGLLGISSNEFAGAIFERFDVKLICITRGQRGSVLADRMAGYEHHGFRVHGKDAVGAGDAFTAGLVHEYLRGSSLGVMSETANRMGAWVASRE
jgi:fructokinase